MRDKKIEKRNSLPILKNVFTNYDRYYLLLWIEEEYTNGCYANFSQSKIKILRLLLLVTSQKIKKLKFKNVKTYLTFVSNTHTTLHNSANMEPGPVGG